MQGKKKAQPATRIDLLHALRHTIERVRECWTRMPTYFSQELAERSAFLREQFASPATSYSPEGNFCSKCNIANAWCQHIQPPPEPATAPAQPVMDWTIQQWWALYEHISAHYEAEVSVTDGKTDSVRLQCVHCEEWLDLSQTISTVLAHAAMHSAENCNECYAYLHSAKPAQAVRHV